MKRFMKVGVALAALLSAAPGWAVDLADGKLSVSGFGRWAYGNTDGNAFLVGRDGGKADNLGFALNLFARPMDRLAVSAQIFYDLTRVNVDWAFAEWRFQDAARLRVGQVKLPFGAYMEVKDVGTLRPFYNLPVSVYGFADIAAESYYGAGVTGALPSLAGVDVSYDVFGGSLWVESNDRFRPAPAATPGAAPAASPSTAPATYHTRLDGTVGGRLTFALPVPGFTVRASGYRGEIGDLGQQTQSASPAGAAFYAYGVSLEYLNEWLEVRAEGFQKSEGRDATRQRARTGYVEAAVRFLERWQVAGRAEGASYDLANPTIPVAGAPTAPYRLPASLRRHEELAVGLNYWFARDLVVKTSYHWVDGNRFAYPESPWSSATTDNAAGAGNPPDVAYSSRTQMFLVGAQLAF